ncbi:MAG: proteasome assembly chaperone 4 family protein [Candidatus Bathyarchaeia archaeon]
MSQTKVLHEESTEEGTLFLATVMELKNSYIVLLSEGEENLGTLAVSIPQRLEISRLPLSSALLGERNIITARLIAERLVAFTNKIVLVSVFIKTTDEVKAGRIFIKLLEKILKKKGETGESQKFP